MEKLLSSDLGGKLGKLLLKLECADRVANEMLRTKAFLDDLEKFKPRTLEQAKEPSLYGSALIPIIDHSIMIYCAAFNSSDRRQNGIGQFDAGNVFGDDAVKNDWHKFLKAHRDKSVAHMTDVAHKVWYLTSKHDRRLEKTGVGGVLQNHLQPGSPEWAGFRQHLEFSRLWFDREALKIRSQIERLLLKFPDDWFDNLPDPTSNPLIAQSWNLRDEIIGQILKSGKSF